jgi:hypothetical protein
VKQQKLLHLPEMASTVFNPATRLIWHGRRHDCGQLSYTTGLEISRVRCFGFGILRWSRLFSISTPTSTGSSAALPSATRSSHSPSLKADGLRSCVIASSAVGITLEVIAMVVCLALYFLKLRQRREMTAERPMCAGE